MYDIIAAHGKYSNLSYDSYHLDVDNRGARVFLNGNSNKFIIKTRLQNTDVDILVIPCSGEFAGNVAIGTLNPGFMSLTNLSP